MKFRPECPPNHAILPEVARYGRMNLGRCIKEAYGYLGCQSDVLNLVDRWCSGRQRCQVKVPNLDLDQANANNQGCMPDLSVYLEINYNCVPGEYKHPLVFTDYI